MITSHVKFLPYAPPTGEVQVGGLCDLQRREFIRRGFWTAYRGGFFAFCSREFIRRQCLFPVRAQGWDSITRYLRIRLIIRVIRDRNPLSALPLRALRRCEFIRYAGGLRGFRNCESIRQRLFPVGAQGWDLTTRHLRFSPAPHPPAKSTQVDFVLFAGANLFATKIDIENFAGANLFATLVTFMHA